MDWVRDGMEAVVKQNKVEIYDPLIVFGPLSARLSHFFSLGYELRSVCYKVSTKTRWLEKIHLVKGREKWLLGRVPRSWFASQNGLTLADHVKEGVQVIYKGSQDFYDPLDQLLLQYPRKYKKSKDMMVGNRTLKEVVKEELKTLMRV